MTAKATAEPSGSVPVSVTATEPSSSAVTDWSSAVGALLARVTVTETVAAADSAGP